MTVKRERNSAEHACKPTWLWCSSSSIAVQRSMAWAVVPNTDMSIPIALRRGFEAKRADGPRGQKGRGGGEQQQGRFGSFSSGCQVCPNQERANKAASARFVFLQAPRAVCGVYATREILPPVCWLNQQTENESDIFFPWVTYAVAAARPIHPPCPMFYLWFQLIKRATNPQALKRLVKPTLSLHPRR